MSTPEAIRAAQKRYYQRHRAKVMAYSREYYKTHRAEARERGRRYDAAHREIRNKRAKLRRQLFPEKVRQVRERAYAKFRAELLAAYGGKCVCCEEQEPKFLALDHVNNDGAKHRREVGAGRRVLDWAKRNGWPKTLQLLCHNCNSAKAFYGKCPHRT